MGYGFWNYPPVVSYEDVKNWGTELFTEMHLLRQCKETHNYLRVLD